MAHADTEDAVESFVCLMFEDPVPLRDVVLFVKDNYPEVDPADVYKGVVGELEVMYMRWLEADS